MPFSVSASNILLSPFHLIFWSIRNFSNILIFLFSPFFLVLYYASYVFTPIFIPFQIMANLESAYIFCGTAAVIGISVGCILALTNTVIFNVLNLTSSSDPSRPGSSSSIEGESVVGVQRLRDERRRERAEGHQALSGKHVQYGKGVNVAAPPKKAKPITTIMEEEDEEEYRASFPAGTKQAWSRASIASARHKKREGESDDSTDGYF